MADTELKKLEERLEYLKLQEKYQKEIAPKFESIDYSEKPESIVPSEAYLKAFQKFEELPWVKRMFELQSKIRSTLAEELNTDPFLFPKDEAGLPALSAEEQKEFKELFRIFIDAEKITPTKERKEAIRVIYHRVEELRKKMREVLGDEKLERGTKDVIKKRETVMKRFLEKIKIKKSAEKIKELEEKVKRLKAEGKTPEEISKITGLTKEEIINRLTNNTETEIDIDMIEFIHGIERQQDGYVAFCNKILKDGKRPFKNIAGLKITELRQYLPGILSYILKDGYFSINASWTAGKRDKNGLAYPLRAEKHLRYLNACYCDIDFYKTKDFTWGEAVGKVLNAIEDRIIPPVTIITNSGRGMYLIWLLVSDREGFQQRAFPYEIELYKQINKELGKRLTDYCPELYIDRTSFDASKVLRPPGSVNTKADTKRQLVNYVTMGMTSPIDKPIYTLKSIADRLNLLVTPTYPALSDKHLRPITNRGAFPGRRKGNIEKGKKRLNDLLTIAQHRQGFKQGKRRRSITYFCYFVKASGHTLSDIEKQAGELAKQCQPPYPSDPSDTPIEDIVKNVWIKGSRNFNNDRLAYFFEITPELAEELDLHSIIPAETANKRKKERENRPSRQEAEQIERREQIKQIIYKHMGNIPSLRKIRTQLENGGLDTDIMTISRDLKIILPELKKEKYV